MDKLTDRATALAEAYTTAQAEAIALEAQDLAERQLAAESVADPLALHQSGPPPATLSTARVHARADRILAAGTLPWDRKHRTPADWTAGIARATGEAITADRELRVRVFGPDWRSPAEIAAIREGQAAEVAAADQRRAERDARRARDSAAAEAEAKRRAGVL